MRGEYFYFLNFKYRVGNKNNFQQSHYRLILFFVPKQILQNNNLMLLDFCALFILKNRAQISVQSMAATAINEIYDCTPVLKSMPKSYHTELYRIVPYKIVRTCTNKFNASKNVPILVSISVDFSAVRLVQTVQNCL